MRVQPESLPWKRGWIFYRTTQLNVMNNSLNTLVSRTPQEAKHYKYPQLQLATSRNEIYKHCDQTRFCQEHKNIVQLSASVFSLNFRLAGKGAFLSGTVKSVRWRHTLIAHCLLTVRFSAKKEKQYFFKLQSLTTYRKRTRPDSKIPRHRF